MLYRFGIDIYLRGEFRGTNYIDVDIDDEDAEILQERCHAKEELPAEKVLADLYADVQQAAIEQEQIKHGRLEYPYRPGTDFSDYSLKIFV